MKVLIPDRMYPEFIAWVREQDLHLTYRRDRSLCATERHQFPDGSVVRLPMGSRVARDGRRTDDGPEAA